MLGSGPKVKSQATVLWRQTRGLRIPFWRQSHAFSELKKSRELFCSSRNYSYLCGVNLKLNDYEITNRMVAMYVADGALGAGGAGLE